MADEGGINNDGRQVHRRTKSGRYAADIKREELEEFFHLPVEEAGEKLGVGLTVLKSICRKFNIGRWPYRKVRRIQWLADRIRAGFGRQHCYRNVKKLIDELNVAPTSPVWKVININYNQLMRQVAEQTAGGLPDGPDSFGDDHDEGPLLESPGKALPGTSAGALGPPMPDRGSLYNLANGGLAQEHIDMLQSLMAQVANGGPSSLASLSEAQASELLGMLRRTAAPQAPADTALPPRPEYEYDQLAGYGRSGWDGAGGAPPPKGHPEPYGDVWVSNRAQQDRVLSYGTDWGGSRDAHAAAAYGSGQRAYSGYRRGSPGYARSYRDAPYAAGGAGASVYAEKREHAEMLAVQGGLNPEQLRALRSYVAQSGVPADLPPGRDYPPPVYARGEGSAAAAGYNGWAPPGSMTGNAPAFATDSPRHSRSLADPLLSRTTPVNPQQLPRGPAASDRYPPTGPLHGADDPSRLLEQLRAYGALAIDTLADEQIGSAGHRVLEPLSRPSSYGGAGAQGGSRDAGFQWEGPRGPAPDSNAGYRRFDDSLPYNARQAANIHPGYGMQPVEQPGQDAYSRDEAFNLRSLPPEPRDSYYDNGAVVGTAAASVNAVDEPLLGVARGHHGPESVSAGRGGGPGAAGGGAAEDAMRAPSAAGAMDQLQSLGPDALAQVSKMLKQAGYDHLP